MAQCQIDVVMAPRETLEKDIGSWSALPTHRWGAFFSRKTDATAPHLALAVDRLHINRENGALPTMVPKPCALKNVGPKKDGNPRGRQSVEFRKAS